MSQWLFLFIGCLLWLGIPIPMAKAAMAVANFLEESPHVGVAYGATPEDANRNALRACGKTDPSITKDCRIYATFNRGPSGYRNRTCLAAAQGYNGDFGYGIGTTRERAIEAALKSCQTGAIAPRYCKRTGAIVCQNK